MKKYIYLFASILVTLAGCQNFEELEKDPNRPATVPPSLILRGILNDMNPKAWDDVQRWNQYIAVNYNYYGNNEYAWTTTTWNYTTLKNGLQMEAETVRSDSASSKPYIALGKFFRAYFLENMTQRVGDIPLTEALQGLSNGTPKYDSQKDVYIAILKYLEDSNTELAKLIAERNTNLSGDIYLNNDLKKWQKVVNTFRLRVLISLSKKENESSLNIKQQFSDILSNPTKYPLMESMNDNLQYEYTSAFNKYPVNPDNFGFDALRYNMAKTYVDLLKNLKDARLFYTAEPAEARVKAGNSPTSYEAYEGASSGEDLANMTAKAQAGEYSFYNRYRYYRTYIAEPTFIIAYPELCFNIAEAINRGWVAGKTDADAESWYKKGMQASINFYGIKEGENTAYFLKKDGNVVAANDYNPYTITFNFDTYYAQNTVKYAGNNATGLTQILQQKYLAFFQNSGAQAFYNQRRTGVPTFLTGPGTGNSQKIPRRWQYPSTERTTNTSNYQAALQQQFNNKTDNINDEIWILK